MNIFFSYSSIFHCCLWFVTIFLSWPLWFRLDCY